MIACEECGASGRLGSCTELFGALLALDHERRQPWGRFHGLNVACFQLQHPSATTVSAVGGQWQVVNTFLAGGLTAIQDLQTRWVRSNRRGARPWPAADSVPARSAPPTVTIEDVSVDGTFPASGYEERMHAWAKSVAAERVTA
ncbi:DUF5946 family protein [Actinophytocola gossypii]|nr:DUF5946 family protein [Actinophytocola gossypii]